MPGHNPRLAFLGWFRIGILLRVLGLFVKVEAEFVSSFMTNRKIWEDKVASLRGTVQVGHSRNRHSCQDWHLRRWWLWKTTSMCHMASHFQSSKKEEISVVRESDIFLFWAFALEDAKLDNRRWINRPSVSRCWTLLAGPHD
jgi:hypothetical protein